MRTIAIRVAVAIDHTGDWCAYGASDAPDSDAMATATETLIPGENRYILTATLTVPEVAEIPAHIESTTKIA